MITNEEIRAHQAKWATFAETELGKAFIRYERDLIRLWMEDRNVRISNRRLRELDDNHRASREAFLRLIDP
jgi:hypothetical protein